MADAHYQHYQMDPRHVDHQQQHYYQQQPQSISPPQYNQNIQYGQPDMGHNISPQQVPPPSMHTSVSPQQHMGNGMPPQQLPDPQAADAQAAGDEYGGNPIPMSQSQLAALLENIALLDTQRIILEPGVMIGETGQILNLNVIRSKVNSSTYTLPDMLVDLNSICEPFLNQGPDHAAYATNFLDQANQAIVDSVRDAQFAAGAAPPPEQGGYSLQQQQPNGYGQPQEPGYPPMDQRSHPSSWVSQVVGEDGHGAGMDPNSAYMNGRIPPNGYPPHMQGHGMASPPDGAKRKAGMKRGPESALTPDREKKPNVQTAPRPRLEGRRCQVCAVIKKAGCGTENAHFRCLKKKKPEIAIELEKRVGELKDVGEEERVTVWNPKEGRKLSGQAAPMLKNLAGWLASHPGWEAHPRVTSTNTKYEAAFQGLPRTEGGNPSSGMGVLTPQPSQMPQSQPPALPTQPFEQGAPQVQVQVLPPAVDQGAQLQPQGAPYQQPEQMPPPPQGGFQLDVPAQNGFQQNGYPPNVAQSVSPQQPMPPPGAPQQQQMAPSPGQQYPIQTSPLQVSPQQAQQQQHVSPQQQVSPQQPMQPQYGAPQEASPQQPQAVMRAEGQMGSSFQNWDQASQVPA